MFIQNCYIKKNTKYLRDRLSSFGYKLNNGKAWGKYLVCFKIRGTEECRFVASPEWDLKNMPDFENAVDCGTNEALFLAIATLRDDSDYMQWRTNDNNSDWFLYETDEIPFDVSTSYSEMYGARSYFRDFHKATVQELIEHFKKY